MNGSFPGRRSNRAHGAIDKLPPEIQLQVRDWLMGPHTFDDVTESLNELLESEGIDIRVNRNQSGDGFSGNARNWNASNGLTKKRISS